MKLYTINTGFFKLDGGAMFGVVPQLLWKKLNPPDANNMCAWALRCLLVEDGNRLMLIDNGMGNKQDDKFFSYYYLHGNDSLDKSLQKTGFSNSDITDAFLTHLHFDHCGGGLVRNGDKIELTFSKANYWSNHAHWQWATHPNMREKPSFLKENILPMQESGHLQFVDVPHVDADGLRTTRFSEHIEIVFVDGHTEKQMLPKIRYKGRTILFCGDLIPSTFHIPVGYVMGYDMRPLDSMREKEILLRQAAQENWILFFEHDPIHECCTVEMTEKGVKAKDYFQLATLFPNT